MTPAVFTTRVWENQMGNPAPIDVALSELFAEEVSTELLRQQQLGNATLSVVTMRYTRWDDSGHPTSVKQTAVLLCDSQLDLPQFAIWPQQGLFLGLTRKLMGMPDINFPDSLDFSQKFHLHGWNEQAVRVLFTHRLRASFEKQRDWSARGIRDWLVVFKDRKVTAGEELDAFVADALRLLEEFQRGEETLDAQPHLSRKVELGDVVERLEAGSGLAGAVLRNQLIKSQVTPAELELFVAQPTPRGHIPPELHRQVVGENGLLVVLGLLFLVVGITIPVPLAFGGNGDARLVGLILGTVFPLVGGGMVFFTMRYRMIRKRLLREGLLEQGKITDVKRTSVEVNNARRYNVTIKYSVSGKPQSTIMHLYANVEKARELHSTEKPVRLLVDPKNHAKVICLDTLLVFD